MNYRTKEQWAARAFGEFKYKSVGEGKWPCTPKTAYFAGYIDSMKYSERMSRNCLVRDEDGCVFEETSKPVICVGRHTINKILNGENVEIDAAIMIPASDLSGTSVEGSPLLDWAISKWASEVKYRPLNNIHRRSLDDAWRQVIRWAGGDPVALVGPSHDQLLEQAEKNQ